LRDGVICENSLTSSATISPIIVAPKTDSTFINSTFGAYIDIGFAVCFVSQELVVLRWSVDVACLIYCDSNFFSLNYTTLGDGLKVENFVLGDLLFVQ
jgi:hypothetical protein